MANNVVANSLCPEFERIRDRDPQPGRHHRRQCHIGVGCSALHKSYRCVQSQVRLLCTFQEMSLICHSYGVEDAEYAISQLAQTTMRSEIGQLSLDHVLKERANLNANITQAINEAAQSWGVVCLRYEIRDIHAPDGVVAAMHRQVTAERSKRAEILESEGQRQSAINIAEGRKQSVILASEAMKAEQINSASGEAEAILLRANATARGIDAVGQAIRNGESSAQSAIGLSVAEKYVDAFGRLAKEGTAVVVPGNVGDMGGMIASALSVYGKVTEGQRKATASKAIEAPKRASSKDIGDQVIEAAKSGQTGDVAKTMLEDFEKARQGRN